MIIKKPYAFLIKNFRIIHTALLVVLGYIVLNTINIYSFYSSYASNQYYVNSASLAASYIDYFIFIAMILAILVSLLIFYILKVKNKERRFYILLCIYYAGLFIYYIVLLGVFQDLQYKTMDFESVRIFRDVTLLFAIPQIIFVFISLGRALGFNIKQFDFKKDLEELQIEESDYEEVEITLGQNNYKYKRMFRKTLRHIKYFILENKFFVTMIGSVCALIVTLVAFVNLKVYNVNYGQKEQILANTLWYTAEDAYITNENLRGEEINPGKYYLLIRVNIDNRVSYSTTLDRNTFKLQIGNTFKSPKFNLGNMFIDIGEAFSPIELESGTEKEYIVVYELNENEIKTEYILKIKNADNVRVGEINTAYKDIIIRPYELNSDNDAGTFVLPNDLDLQGTTLYNTKLHISSYEVSSSFKEQYQYCERAKCYNGTYSITPSKTGVGETTLLKISSTLNLDDSLYINKYITAPDDLYTYFATLSYRTEGVRKKIKLSSKNIKYNEDKNSYFEIPKDVERANKINLILELRGIKYTIVLK